MAQINSKETVQTVRFLQARAKKQLSAFYQRPYAVVSTELLATIISVIVLGMFAIRPTLVTMSQLVKDIEDRRETLDGLTRKVASLSTLQTELPALQTNIARLHSAVPDHPDLDGILRRIEFIASQNGVVIESLRSVEVPSEHPAESVDDSVIGLPITLNVSGSYASISAFLTSLMLMDRYVIPDSVTIQSSRDLRTGTSTGQITMNLSLQFLYRGVK